MKLFVIYALDNEKLDILLHPAILMMRLGKKVYTDRIFINQTK